MDIDFSNCFAECAFNCPACGADKCDKHCGNCGANLGECTCEKDMEEAYQEFIAEHNKNLYGS